jgi:hypothetical protein
VKRQGDISKTQTLRTLTILELEEEAASGWFAVQLAQADEAFVPEEVGTHAIFNAYRLYSVAEIQQGNIVHALRLGFFTDELSAQAVASYLSTFYDKPEIKRISVAEHRRFAQQSMAPRQPATREPGGATASAATEAKKERIPAAARNAQSTNR